MTEVTGEHLILIALIAATCVCAITDHDWWGMGFGVLVLLGLGQETWTR